MIGVRGLRRSRWGSKALAAMNMVGSRCTRLVFALHRGPETVNGYKMYLSQDGGPSLSFTMELLGGKYEQETRQLLERVIGKDMIIVDVGAHVGYYALQFARWVGPGGKVFAFEPEADNHALLRKNIALNRCTNVYPVPKAVSDHSGTVKLFVSSQGNDRHSIFENPRSVVRERVREVATVSLDEFLAGEGWPPVDVVKMDVEGAEPLALEGMRKLIARSAQFKLVVEFAPEALRFGGNDPARFLERLAELGLGVESIESGGELRPWRASDFPSLAAEAEARGMVNLYCTKL